MEPFGLFHFLKTFLDSAPSENAPAPPKSDVSATENEELSPQEYSTQPEENSSSIDAVLQFMDAHERRAKNLRKP